MILFLGELKVCISKLNIGKTVGKDVILAGIFRYGGGYLADILHAIILDIWNTGSVPKFHAMLILLYRIKCIREICVHYRGILCFTFASG